MKYLGRGLLIATVSFVIFLSYVIKWGTQTFDGTGMDAVFFELSMPLKGTSSETMDSFYGKVVMPTAISSVIFLILMLIRWKMMRYEYVFDINIFGSMKRKVLRLKKIPVMACLAALLVWSETLWVYADRAFEVNDYLKARIRSSDFIENEYIDPKDMEITFPGKKKNLVWILLESGETSAQDVGNGGIQPVNYIPELTALAKENVSFSESEDLLQGAAVASPSNWTMAGMVSQMAGVPLKIPVGMNSMSEYEEFMPGVVAIGDLLGEEGYHNMFLCGSDITFGGRKDFLEQHGDYEIFDYVRAVEEERISDYVWWGFEDRKLYQFAREKMTELYEEGEPFNLTLLTVDTHAEDGYICDICSAKYESQYGNVWACASRQAADFVEWIQEQDFYDDTVIIISGDHLSYDKDFYEKYDKNEMELTGGAGTRRRVYNAFINSAKIPYREKGRAFTTLDMFPTVLSSLGVNIEGDRLALGTDLFSETETLAEKYGYQWIFSEMDKRSDFYNAELLDYKQ